MEIRKVDIEEYRGYRYDVTYHSDFFYDIRKSDEGFSLQKRYYGSPREFSLKDELLIDQLENPVAYGCFEGDRLVGFTEGFLEKWNNRFRITNIVIFDEDDRHKGVGTLLMQKMIEEGKKAKARMAVLETQSGNGKAIDFYISNGFEIIGFDLYCYYNDGPDKNEVRVEMGRILD